MNDDLRLINDVFRIVGGALRLDIAKVRNYTNYLADRLDQAGQRTSAARLRKLLEGSDHSLRPAGLATARSMPVDSESRFPLVERVNPRFMDEPPLVLSVAQWDIVNEFMSVAQSRGQLEAEGVVGSLGMLLYGPPGCGKSRLARHIARELGLELCVARLDGLISSYLGSTSKNVRALFDFASSTPCVLFLDEFDAIAKLRGDNQELGELKRVVNSFIQNLDGLGAQTIVLAATNHEELLDRAVWRRFAYRLELGYPSREERASMWVSFLQPLGLEDREIEILADVSEGFSGSDLFEVSLRLRRRHVMTGAVPVLPNAFKALQNLSDGEGRENRFLSKLNGASSQAIAAALRHRNKGLYSLSSLAQLLGVSKATAHRWAVAGGRRRA